MNNVIDDLDDDAIRPLSLLRRWWPLLLMGLALGALFGSRFAESRPRVYETQILVLVGPVVPNTDALEGNADLARTYGEIVETRRVIEAAVTGLDVDPSDVIVGATAGRKSSTLAIDVTTPSRQDTPLVALALVEALGTVIDENTASTDIGETRVTDANADEGFDDLLSGIGTGSVPIGSALTIIDDGGGRAADRSLGAGLGGAIGAIAAVFLVGAVALAVESTRVARPRSLALNHLAGGDLGRLRLAPNLPSLVARSRPRSISGDARVMHDATLIAEQLMDDSRTEPAGRLLFVAAPSTARPYILALLQLVAGFDEPPAVIDPGGALAAAVACRTELVPRRQYALSAGNRTIGHLVVPSAHFEPPVSFASDALATCRQLAAGAATVIVFAPIDHRSPSWRHWAKAADHAVILTRRRDLRDRVLGELVTRLRGAQPSLLGGVLIGSGRVRRNRLAVGLVTELPTARRQLSALRSRKADLGQVD